MTKKAGTEKFMLESASDEITARGQCGVQGGFLVCFKVG